MPTLETESDLRAFFDADHFAVEVTYVPIVGESFAVAVLPTEQDFGDPLIAGTRRTTPLRMFEVLALDVPQPRKGDLLVSADGAYEVRSFVSPEIERTTWRLDCVPRPVEVGPRMTWNSGAEATWASGNERHWAA